MAEIHPSAVVDRTVRLGEDVRAGPNCVICGGVEIGAGTRLDANVFIGEGVKIGSNNRFFPHSAIGSIPQILALGPDTRIGELVIGDGNVFREQVTIHPSMSEGGKTVIGNDNFLMIGAHIGHDCILADRIVISNYVQIGGHCRIETGVWLSGLAGAHQFVTIGKWSYVAGLAGVTKDVPPFLTVSGHYPPRVRGVNKRGMQRAGLTAEQQARIIDAYKRLYRQGGALLANARSMAQEDGLDENVRAIVEAIDRSSQHRFGRYLETLRHG
ncbi:MAG: acyl-ACP--UDP-N-acetylglucosamine O-acyltransferase [Phycisphaerales bacterium]|nr:MAG: acyl-ACP--UDP-N-acetylglucosamine O-acyltransferase [Phycisphaerales bacterium]